MYRINLTYLVLIFSASFVCIKTQFISKYTTNVYGRRPFECFKCTNNYDSANSRGRYDQATNDCGFYDQFNPHNPLVKRELCYTFCMKKEVGIVGSRIDVERRCEPNCQEYNGNTRLKYIVDRVSCCVGNACNLANKPASLITISNYLLYFICFLILILI